MKKTFATSLGKAAAFTAIALAVTAAVAQDAERGRPLHADVKINKQLIIIGQPPANFNPQFTFDIKITENKLPPTPEGCKWETPTYQPPGGTTTATTGGAAQVTVINRLKCDSIDKPQGRLTVNKVVNNTLGVSTPSTFSMAASCTPSGPLNVPLSIPSGSGVSLATPIAAGSNCSVNEPPLAPIAKVKACNDGSASWTTSYAPTSVTIVANTVSTITVTNTLKCDKVTSPAPVIISNLPMQGGTYITPCPPLGVVLPRSTTAPAYLAIMLPNLDMQCSTKGPGFKLQSIKFLTCAPDPRGPGFGPNATADLTCGP